MPTSELEVEHLKAHRDAAIRYEQAHRLMTTLGFFICLVGGFAFGYMAGHSSAQPEVVEQGLWERGTPVGVDD